MPTGFNLRPERAQKTDDTPKTDDERLAVRRRAQIEAARGINESSFDRRRAFGPRGLRQHRK